MMCYSGEAGANAETLGRALREALSSTGNCRVIIRRNSNCLLRICHFKVERFNNN